MIFTNNFTCNIEIQFYIAEYIVFVLISLGDYLGDDIKVKIKKKK